MVPWLIREKNLVRSGLEGNPTRQVLWAQVKHWRYPTWFLNAKNIIHLCANLTPVLGMSHHMTRQSVTWHHNLSGKFKKSVPVDAQQACIAQSQSILWVPQHTLTAPVKLWYNMNVVLKI